nr:membrane bound O-acyl transferase family-domain-containing protein [Planctomycetota bacterium]
TLSVALGAALVWGGVAAVGAAGALAQGWVGMVGIVLMLHFGVFRLVSCAWRSAGVEARPLMDRPLAAVSLGEFWGRRWNTAFRDLTHRCFYAPLARRWSPRVAILGGFLLSGVVHDLVISLPARGGYGLPTAYFALQALGLLVERSPFGRRLGLGRGRAGWSWTMLVVAVPVGLLFHPAFIRVVILPFLAALGAA